MKYNELVKRHAEMGVSRHDNMYHIAKMHRSRGSLTLRHQSMMTKLSVAHWERMIAVVRELPSYTGRQDVVTALRWHLETAEGTYCALCTYAGEKGGWGASSICTTCPIPTYTHPCDFEDSVYNRVTKSLTARDWLEAAEEMLSILKKCNVVYSSDVHRRTA